MWRLTRISSFRPERLAIRSNYLGVSGISRINLKPRKIRCHLSTLPEIPIIDYAVDNKLVRSKEISIEDQYTRKTPLEHVLLRPGMYVGPNERLPPSSCWVIDPPILPPTMEFMKAALQDPLNIQKQVEEATKFHIVKKELGLVPAMLKVFDEILVNASDNRFRHPDSCTRIDVIIDPGSEKHDPLILVFNDGKGIPIHMHKDEGIYVPEMLFGHLLTGSNFDDNEERLTGGRHGYGAKLANIFSKSFTVETLDSQNRLKYKQIWNTNMTESTLPKITKTSAKLKDYTCVSFVPDIVRLTGINDATKISDDDFAIMCRRVVDVAGCAAGKLKVTLNGQNVSQSSFSEYSQMYRKPETSPLCFHSINPRWNVGVGLSESGSFDSVSFVNGMSTNRGGSHVNVIVQQLTKYIQEHVEKINPELAEMINPSLIRRQLFVWCDAQIVNPTFDSQMKEYLTSSPTSFGSSYTLSNKYIRDILKDEEKGGPGIIEEILRIAKGRQQASLLKDFSGKKSKRHILSIPKLEDAHDAGSNLGSDCTLILTEGDSAKALAVAGLEVIGRKKFGVFPLRGKLLNVRDASISQLSKNAEVKALCSIIGLDFDKEYATTDERKELRYGHVMLMTDQDTDGSHIKGLVINFFRNFWPHLLQPPVDQPNNNQDPTFMSCFVTPLLKATKKGTKTQLSFFSASEYNYWRDKLDPSDLKKWTVKYYKGLGTSTPAEAKAYFKDFDKHVRPFYWNSESDGEALDMVFDKKRASDRRDWILEQYDETSSNPMNSNADNSMTYEDFINNEMIHFSHADNKRSIPSAIDGLKPSHRKVLYACFKRKLNAEVKVAQLSGYCAEHTAYHHGEASLQSTIVGMAQDFVGSNNINLLVPSGQFGTRLMGGTDAASARYIFTHLNPVTRYLFPEADDVLLQYKEEDGQKIEPEFFCPIIPLLLVNGSQGIGTGWSTFIPPYNPKDLLDYIQAKLDNADEMPALYPFARDFTGTIEPNSNGNGYVTYGRASVVNEKSIVIEELPLRMWTSTYKDYLLRMRDKGLLTTFVENHTTTKVSFTVNIRPNQIHKMSKSGLEKAFGLKSFLSTNNMYAFDASNQLKKFDKAEDIIDEYFPVRLELYHHRKSVIESEARYSAVLQRNKARFIQLVTNGEINIMSGRATKQETSSALANQGFSTLSELKAIRNDNSLYKLQQLLPEISEIETIDENDGSEFDYLLNMPLSSLTVEKISELKKDAVRKEEELDLTQSTTAADLWRQDLKSLAKHLK